MNEKVLANEIHTFMLNVTDLIFIKSEFKVRSNNQVKK